jgi:hypothetical protein
MDNDDILNNENLNILNEDQYNVNEIYDPSSMSNNTDTKYILDNLTYKPYRNTILNINQKYVKLNTEILKNKNKIDGLINTNYDTDELINEIYFLKTNVDKLESLIKKKEEILNDLKET